MLNNRTALVLNGELKKRLNFLTKEEEEYWDYIYEIESYFSSHLSKFAKKSAIWATYASTRSFDKDIQENQEDQEQQET